MCKYLTSGARGWWGAGFQPEATSSPAISIEARRLSSSSSVAEAASSARPEVWSGTVGSRPEAARGVVLMGYSLARGGLRPRSAGGYDGAGPAGPQGRNRPPAREAIRPPRETLALAEARFHTVARVGEIPEG